MGKLKPIGSEKLEGIDKIRRMIELSQYNLNTPKPINEVSSNEYRKTLADGNTYHIVKEKTGYVIKKGLYESTAEYIEPIKSRRFYPSYSQALKRLNLITKEVNLNEGQTRNISLFTENDDVVEYFLDLDEQADPTPPAPAPAPAPVPAPPTEEPMSEPPMPEPPTEEPMPEPEMPPMDDEGDEDEDEVVTMKSVQKATGKLAQKIRTFLADEENEMTSEDTKYVINSVLSALDLSSLDDEDLDEIIAKFEGEEDGEEMPEPSMDGEMGGQVGSEMPSGDEVMTPPPPMPPAPSPEGEMTEYRTHGARKNRHVQQIEELIEDIFSESKVDKVLDKYFKTKPKKDTITRIQKLSESFKQEVNAVEFHKKYKNSTLLGRNKYGQLVFEKNNEKFRISPSGQIL
jgi:hypothetical protein